MFHRKAPKQCTLINKRNCDNDVYISRMEYGENENIYNATML